MRYSPWTAALTAALLASSSAYAQTRVGDDEFRQTFRSTTMLLETGVTTCEAFEIFLAVERAQKNRGLMFVQSMRAEQGMLFVYPPESRMSMWMKNTVISLDIVFLDSSGQIINIAERTEPYSLASVRAAGPGSFVLEVNAGRAAELDLKTGTTLFRPDLAPL
ncbi:MAG: DUF192 domain-containing protein [Pseudomonadota bacterium]